jgi:2-keto-4-pentenoate hydratase/2-oxohepta-3-ene-1,7-dioic acid hydratase in catechol pathway
LDRWLKPGDVVELEVEGLGILRNRIVREGEPSRSGRPA